MYNEGICRLGLSGSGSHGQSSTPFQKHFGSLKSITISTRRLTVTSSYHPRTSSTLLSDADRRKALSRPPPRIEPSPVYLSTKLAAKLLRPGLWFESSRLRSRLSRCVSLRRAPGFRPSPACPSAMVIVAPPSGCVADEWPLCSGATVGAPPTPGPSSDLKPAQFAGKRTLGLERRVSAELGITTIPPPYLCGTL